MKTLYATFRATDGNVASHYRARDMKGEDVPTLLHTIRDDIDKELGRIENCPAVRAARKRALPTEDQAARNARADRAADTAHASGYLASDAH